MKESDLSTDDFAGRVTQRKPNGIRDAAISMAVIAINFLN